MCTALLAPLRGQSSAETFPIDPGFDRFVALDREDTEEVRKQWGPLVARLRNESDPLIDRLRDALRRDVANQASARALSFVPPVAWRFVHEEALDRLKRGQDVRVLIRKLADVDAAIPELGRILRARLLDPSDRDLPSVLSGLLMVARNDPEIAEGLDERLLELLPEEGVPNARWIASLLLNYGERPAQERVGALLLIHDDPELLELGALFTAAFGVQDDAQARRLVSLLEHPREGVRRMARRVVPACGPGRIEVALQALDPSLVSPVLMRRARGDEDLVFADTGWTDLSTLRALCFARRQRTPGVYVDRLIRDLTFGWSSVRGAAACEALVYADIPDAQLLQVLVNVLRGDRARRPGAPRQAELLGERDHLARFARLKAEDIAIAISRNHGQNIRLSEDVLDWLDSVTLSETVLNDALIELCAHALVSDQTLVDRAISRIDPTSLPVSVEAVIGLSKPGAPQLDWAALLEVDDLRIRAKVLRKVPWSQEQRAIALLFDALEEEGEVFEIAWLRLGRVLARVDPESLRNRPFSDFESRGWQPPRVIAQDSVDRVVTEFCRRYAVGSEAQRDLLRALLVCGAEGLTPGQRSEVDRRIGAPSPEFVRFCGGTPRHVTQPLGPTDPTAKGSSRARQNADDEDPESLLRWTEELAESLSVVSASTPRQREEVEVKIFESIGSIARLVLEDGESVDERRLRPLLRDSKGLLRGDAAAALAYRFGDRDTLTLQGLGSYLVRPDEPRLPEFEGLSAVQARVVLEASTQRRRGGFRRNRLVSELGWCLDASGAKQFLGMSSVDEVDVFEALTPEVVAELDLLELKPMQIRAFAFARLDELLVSMASLDKFDAGPLWGMILQSVLFQSPQSRFRPGHQPFRSLPLSAAKTLAHFWNRASYEERRMLITACESVCYTGSAGRALKRRIDVQRQQAAEWPANVARPAALFAGGAGGRPHVPLVYWPAAPLRVDFLARVLGEARTMVRAWFDVPTFRRLGYSDRFEFRLSEDLERQLLERIEPLLDLDAFRERLLSLPENERAGYLRSILPELSGETRLEALRWMAMNRVTLTGREQDLVVAWVQAKDLELADWAFRVARLGARPEDAIGGVSPAITDPIQAERMELVRLAGVGLRSPRNLLRVLLRLDDPSPQIRIAAANTLAAHVRRTGDESWLAILRSRRERESHPGVQGVLARILGDAPKRDR